ncbi:MAG TPA: hypothetical protein PK563_14380 [Tenuifilaceae bacterium]|nr:hypothetical protein [Tenuifilaceae bacterium]
MKNIKILGILCGILILTAFCCNENDDEEELLSAQGYIVGFDPCCVRHHYRLGYVIVSEDLIDTLVTYNLSDITYTMPASVVFNSNTLYQIPEIYFQNFVSTAYFPDSLRYSYGVKVSYRMARENELVIKPCALDINWGDFAFQIINNQVIIRSAIKY